MVPTIFEGIVWNLLGEAVGVFGAELCIGRCSGERDGGEDKICGPALYSSLRGALSADLGGGNRLLP